MYINTVSSKVTGIHQYLLGISKKAAEKKTTSGRYKNVYVFIDEFKDEAGQVLQKKYTFWNREIFLTWYKNRKENIRK